MVEQQGVKKSFSRGTTCLTSYKILLPGIMMVLGFTMSACAQNLELVKMANKHHKV